MKDNEMPIHIGLKHDCPESGCQYQNEITSLRTQLVALEETLKEKDKELAHAESRFDKVLDYADGGLQEELQKERSRAEALESALRAVIDWIESDAPKMYWYEVTDKISKALPDYNSTKASDPSGEEK